MEFKFKKEKSFEVRRAEYEKIIKRYPDKIPLICEKAPRSKIKSIDKTKYLIEPNLSLPQFNATIRKKLDLDDKEAIFFLINGKTSLSGNDTLGTIYNKYKSNDGFIYIAYASEEIWGAYQ